jgi:uncharacterized protein (TIGR04255 family)
MSVTIIGAVEHDANFALDVWFSNDEPSAIFLSRINDLAKRNQYPHFVELPILDLPKSIREQNKQLQGQPWYEFSKNNNIDKLYYAPDVFGLAAKDKYANLREFCSPEIIKIFKSFFLLDKVIVRRIGLRYVHFFPNTDIFKTDHSTVRLGVFDVYSNNDKVIVFGETSLDEFKIKLNANNRTTTNEVGGSTVDITAYIDDIELSFNGIGEKFNNDFAVFCDYVEKMYKVHFSLMNKIIGNRTLSNIGGGA